MTIGEQISMQRRRKSMTQEMLSEISGISLRTIQRIESNNSVPRAFTLKTLADLLELDLEKMTETPDQPIADDSEPSSNHFALRMNLAGLSVIVMPLLPVIIMLAVWVRNRRGETSRVTEKRIISFQLIWLTLTLFVLVTTKVLFYYITGFHAIGHLSPLLPAYILMLTFNLFAVIYSAPKLQKQKLGAVYGRTPTLF